MNKTNTHINNIDDIVLHRFFEKNRWEKALDKGVDKGICFGALRELSSPQNRLNLFRSIRDNKYEITPPRCVSFPKDTPGEYRQVYINDDKDRFILSIANDLFAELMPELIHSSCKSYQKELSCGKIVTEISNTISSFYRESQSSTEIGWKADLSRYFDSVRIDIIDSVFDKIEEKYGKSALVSLIRRYYHNNYYKDKNGEIKEKSMSLKQGCAVSAFLANVVLFIVDNELSSLDGYYVRYCDDIVFVGKDYTKAMTILEEKLESLELKLNPKKVKPIFNDQWFNFLGFSIKGDLISLSPSQIKKFKQEIMKRAFKKNGLPKKESEKHIQNFLYLELDNYSWAKRILRYINSKTDIDTLNNYVMDAIRASKTGKRRIGGLGYISHKTDGCIQRTRGKNVRSNRKKTSCSIDNYFSIGCMKNIMKISQPLYETILRDLKNQ